MRKDIEDLVAYYKRKAGTSDPFEISDFLHIQVQRGELGSRSGCYMYLKKHKCIFLNENLLEPEDKLVMAHELGHAIMHPKENCYFIKNKTLLLNSKNEIEANKFAAYLLIPNEIILENWQYTTEQLARLTGYNEELIKLRLESSCNKGMVFYEAD